MADWHAVTNTLLHCHIFIMQIFGSFLKHFIVIVWQKSNLHSPLTPQTADLAQDLQSRQIQEVSSHPNLEP